MKSNKNFSPRFHDRMKAAENSRIMIEQIVVRAVEDALKGYAIVDRAVDTLRKFDTRIAIEDVIAETLREWEDHLADQ